MMVRLSYNEHVAWCKIEVEFCRSYVRRPKVTFTKLLYQKELKSLFQVHNLIYMYKIKMNGVDSFDKFRVEF